MVHEIVRVYGKSDSGKSRNSYLSETHTSIGGGLYVVIIYYYREPMVERNVVHQKPVE